MSTSGLKSKSILSTKSWKIEILNRTLQVKTETECTMSMYDVVVSSIA